MLKGRGFNPLLRLASEVGGFSSWDPLPSSSAHPFALVKIIVY
jgi:hypothetical protein